MTVDVIYVSPSISIETFTLTSHLSMKKNLHCRNHRQPRGFALIATISVMVLLVMIAMAMLSLSTIEMRATQNDRAMVEAKANARMALMLALGELQQYAGQDQRVTARAEMFDKSITNGSWIGVWNSSKMPNDLSAEIFTRDKDTGSLLDARNGQSNDIFFKNSLTWLVSGDTTTPGEPLADPAILRAAVADVPEVTVGKVEIHDKSGAQTGSYAWFVDDLSMKANISHDNRKDRPADLAEAGGDEVAPYFAPHGVGNYHDTRLEDLKKEDISKLVTLGTVGVPAANKDLQRELAGDYTHYSVSLLTDSLNGGLKKDLTAYAKSTAATLPTWNSAAGDSYPAVATDYNILETNPNSALNVGRHTTYGPKLGLIKSWMNLDVRGSAGNYSVAPVAPEKTSYDLGPVMTENSALSLMTGGTEISVPNIKLNTTAAVHPVMTLCDNQMKLIYDENVISLPGFPAITDLHKAYFGFFPRVVLWNPYNVTMNTKGYYVQGSYQFQTWMNIPNGGLFVNEEGGADVDCITYFAKAVTQKGKIVESSQAKDFDNPIYRPIFYIEPTALAPGQSIEFTPKNNVDWVVGTKPGDLVLSANGTRDTSFRVEVGLVGESHRNTAAGKKLVGVSNVNYSTIVRNIPSFGNENTYGSAGAVAFHRNWYLYTAEAADQTWSSITTSNAIYQSFILGPDGYRGLAPPYHDAGSTLYSTTQYEDDEPSRNMKAVFGFRWMHFNEKDPILTCFNNQVLHAAPIANFNTRASWNMAGLVNNQTGNDDHNDRGNGYAPFMPASATKAYAEPRMEPLFAGNLTYPFGSLDTFAAAERVVLFDLPKPDYGVPSIGILQHLNFSPFIWHPSYTLGNSYADIRYERDKTSINSPDVFDDASWANLTRSVAARTTFNTELRTQGAISGQLLQYDLAYELNFNMWDRFFMSSNTVKNATSNLGQTWQATLPDSGAWVSPYLQVSKAREGSIAENEGFHRVAEYLSIPGGFNPNSTSVNAWKSFLSSASSAGDRYKGETGGDKLTTFSRSHPAYGDHFDIEDSDALLSEPGYWDGFRRLTDAQLTKLAEKIVEQVRERGPFLSVGDFVNRRLDTGDSGLSGALQAAIDKSGLNANNPDDNDVSHDFGDELVDDYGLSTVGYYKGFYENRADMDQDHELHSKKIGAASPIDYQGLSAAPKSRARNSSGFLQQGDILQALGPRLSTRGDSFVIRVSGESFKNGKVVATAYAEAVVQRTTEPVNKTWDGIEPESKNQPIEYGRKFKIVSFRWLNVNELKSQKKK